MLAQDLGIVLSASHNPPEYNGVKFFTSEGHKLSDDEEEAIEALLDAPAHGRGSVEIAEDAAAGYVAHILEHFGSDLTRPADRRRLCERRLLGDRARASSSSSAREVTTVAAAPDGSNINVGCGATDLGLLQEVVRAGDFDLGVAFDGDGDRMLAVDETGDAARRRPDPRDPRARARASTPSR